MTLQLQIGLDAITSYRRLAYTPWHAIAEFVDNSTQAYFDNRESLDSLFAEEGETLTVSIAYDRNADRGGLLRVTDNSVGMSFEDLERAMHIALPPANRSGRSRYGMGLKTAACWIGNVWAIRTKTAGDSSEHRAEVDVERVAAGSADISYQAVLVVENRTSSHYTILEISHHNRPFMGRTIGKIKDFLRSMYREDMRNEVLTLVWQGSTLEWREPALLTGQDGSPLKKGFEFEVDGRAIRGWVGILARGSRADAGFLIVHCGRVVRGWPDSWRPGSLYGQLQGSNDLINQRLVGEIHLDSFEVSHTKDDILWFGDQEEQVGRLLKESCGDYREMAKRYRKGGVDERGPSALDTSVAVDELQRELEAPEMVDAVRLEPLPPEVVSGVLEQMVTQIASRPETFSADIDGLQVRGYIAADTSPDDPYVAWQSAADQIVIVINAAHPHWSQLQGSEGVLNYLRDCTYDSIAEWRAARQLSATTPETVRLLKDRLLRVPFEMEMHSGSAGGVRPTAS